MKLLKNLKQYTPDEPALGGAVAYLCDEDGNDWYEQQKEFSPDTVKIAYDSDGIIWAVSRDVSMLWPVNLSVAEIAEEKIPGELTDVGLWAFDGKSITPRKYSESERIKLVEEKKKQLLADANQKTQAWQTQLMLGMISDADKKLLITWMEYVQKIQALDGNEVVKWPEPPK
ncbi:tail fiber assembly protein [Serratia marcescens]|uniref:Tail fiber assembly protein n=1 Tax=Serratia marcescens TaxID=615 RepID=A0A5C7CJE5_SERMA|nr:tail fiber assembly protein [Serratia marcescens]TXE36452.1 tail fiber assembly protein [Serratia marcescens]TXE60859.1 tail fiber assembly protein [Serratia marcescens]